MTFKIESGEEIWRSVVGFDDQYEVSNLGRVRSLDRTIIDQPPSFRRRHFKGRVLSMPPDTDGYPQVSLPKIGMRRVCKLVLEAFVGPKPDGTEALHYDGDNKNSTLSNLSWGSHAQNMQDRLRHGRNHLAKLDDERVAAIRRSDQPASILAAEHSVHRKTIERIRSRKIWKHIA